jgi:serine/threonine-protein kinase
MLQGAIVFSHCELMMNLRRVLATAALTAVFLGAYALRVHVLNARALAIGGATPPPPFFPAGSIWTHDISGADVDPNSDATIQWLANTGGWGSGKMRVDFSMRVLQAMPSSPQVPFRPAHDFYRSASDLVPSIPLPLGGGTEGRPDYQCPVSEQDCHLIIVDRDHHTLYEALAASYDGKAVSALILVLWDLNRIYPPSGRGDQCTSADAAGYPIAPLMFNADELASGHIDHAIRFILPNDRIRAGVFMHPATHAGSPSGPALAPPYGVHLRLKPSYDISRLRPAAQVVARSMQKYGMFLADGGTIALTAQNDSDTRAKYSDVGFGSYDLQALKVTDFEVLKEGPLIPLTHDCARNP